MRDDVFLKFEYGALDILRGMRARLPRRRLALAAGMALAGCTVLAVILSSRTPGWFRLLGAWLLAFAAVHTAFTALRALPHAMFRSPGVRPAPPARGDFWNRKMSVDASGDGLIVTVGQRSATLKWHACDRVESDAGAHVVYLGADGFLVVPRRAFRNDQQDAAFRDLASRLIDEARTPLPAPPSTPAAVAMKEAPAGVVAAKVGRNDPCPCGSGKKYKRCCLGGAA